MQYIYPIYDRMLGRSDKEQLLNQKSLVIWFLGLSGSGKSTLSIALERELHKMGILTQILDGDNIRSGINNNLTFSETDRLENIRRIAEISKLMMNCGVVTINSFITPQEDMRKVAKEIIGEENFFEIFVDTPLEECERRDVKGLYKKARAGEIKNFTGLDSPFEVPQSPDLIIDTLTTPVEKAIEIIIDSISNKISIDKPIIE